VEIWEVVVNVGIALSSSAAGAGAIVWSLSSRLQDAKNRLSNAELRLDKLETKVNEDRRDDVRQWADLNRVLGQIEGRLSNEGPAPLLPPRPRLPSR